jgi:hypothetical protein
MSSKRAPKPAAPPAKPLTIGNAEDAGRAAYEEAAAKPQPAAPAPPATPKPNPYDAKLAAMSAMEVAARQTEVHELRDLFGEFEHIATNADLSLMVRLLRTYQANQPCDGHDPLLPTAFMEEVLARADESSLIPLRPALRANPHQKEKGGITELQQQLTAFIVIGLSGVPEHRLQEVAQLVDMQLTGMLSRPAELFIRDAIKAHYNYGGLTLEWVQHQIDPENPDGFRANFEEAIEHRQRWAEMYGAHDDAKKEAA